ncbi:MAG: cyclic nucleotide-binding domain-containing protein [Planctomycetota bacterium]|nr:MAG: cyclic nucleotide-binding domain-containing protein [Planctomycetota bacterium]
MSEDDQAPRRTRVTERFTRVPIFAMYLEDDEVARILAISDEISVRGDSEIFGPGEENDGFYIIIKGRVNIDLPSERGGRTTIATLSNRSVFGEMSFLRGDRKRSAWAHATEPTVLTKVRGDAFREMLEKGDVAAYKVIYNFAQLIAARLRRVEDELLDTLDELGPKRRERKLAELQEFRQKLFKEWSF